LGGLALLAFAWRCRRVAAPLLKLSLFSNPQFIASASLSFLVGLAMFGALVAWPLYFLVIRGYGLQQTGFAMFGFALGSAALPLSGRLTDRFGGGPVCLGGTVLLAIGCVLAAFVEPGTSIAVLELALLLLGTGTAFIVVPTFTAAYVAVSPPDVPDAVTIVNILLRVGGAVGVSLVIAVIGDQTSHAASRISPFHDAFWLLAGVSIVCCLGAAVLIGASRALRARVEIAGGKT
jgi:MFS family permease